jgi:hypothetical protein
MIGSGHETGRPFASALRIWLVGAWACVAWSGCGAWDESAPPMPVSGTCAEVDERLAPLLSLANSGQLSAIGQVIATKLDPDTQRAVLQLVLDVLRSLPADAPKRLPTLLTGSGLQQLAPVVLAVLTPLPGDSQTVPPTPPMTAEMTAFSRVAQSCLGQQTLQVLATVARDPLMAPTLQALLAPDSAVLNVLRTSLVQAGIEGRTSFAIVVRNALLSLATPGTDMGPMFATLENAASLDPTGTLLQLANLLRMLVNPADPQQALHQRAVIASLCDCLLRLDPDLKLVGHLYDTVLVAPLPAEASAATDSVADLPELLDYAARMLETVAAKPQSLDAVSQLFGLVLRPDVATTALPDLLTLLRGDVITGVVALLDDLLGPQCAPGAP